MVRVLRIPCEQERRVVAREWDDCMYTLVWLKERETERGGGGRKREREKGRKEGGERQREGRKERQK